MTRSERQEINDMWERLDALEEITNILIDKLHIDLVGEAAQENEDNDRIPEE